MKIFLGVPCGTGTMPIETVRSIIALEGITNIAFVANALVYDARNEIMQHFLKSDCDYLFFLDDDMVVEPNTAVRLVQAAEEHNMDLVTAMIFKRKPPYSPCFYGQISWHNKKPSMHSCVDWQENVLIPIKACGLAACVIKRSVLEDFGKIIDKIILPDGSVGEDIQFCLDMATLGRDKLACHTGIDTGHIERRQIGSKQWFEYYETHKEEFPIKEKK